MPTLQMPLVHGVIIIIAIASTYRGYRHGATSTALSCAVIALVILLSRYTAQELGFWIEGMTHSSPEQSILIAFALAFGLFYLVATIGLSRSSRTLDMAQISLKRLPDRLLGAGLGAARGALCAFLLVCILLTYYAPHGQHVPGVSDTRFGRAVSRSNFLIKDADTLALRRARLHDEH